MKRGDIIPVVQAGSYGKPRPALLIQSNFFLDVHPSITILPLTSYLREAPLFRLRVEPSDENGLQNTSEIMVDKITTVPREKASDTFGHLENMYLKEAERLLAVWLGISD